MLPAVLLFFGAVAAYYIARYLWELLRVSSIDKKAVLITGCDSGFGNLLAKRLAKNGQKVFAGCLTEKAICELRNKSPFIEAFQMDVTKDESVNESVKYVKANLKQGECLWAVVNNAGIVPECGPDDWLMIDSYKAALDVNTIGVIRVTKAFKELIKDSRGRIVTMISQAGRVCIMGFGPYSVSKYALEAYVDTIRQELRPFGVVCPILEPGFYKTNMTEDEVHMKRIENTWSKTSEDTKLQYGEAFKEAYKECWLKVLEGSSTNPDEITDYYEHAINGLVPRLRYRCGWNAILLHSPLAFMPTEIEDFIFRLVTKNFAAEKIAQLCKKTI